jgi:hypothetical protein
MRILAVIVNYGTEQIEYLRQVVSGLKKFKNHEVTVIVHSNYVSLHGVVGIDKINFYELNDYQMLPMTCRQTIWDNRFNYDVFIYGENDHLFKEHHLDKHLEYSLIVPWNRITGLFQFEKDKKGNLYYPAYHGQYDWKMDSVEEYGGKKFAHFTNLHQATFILTREQLLECGDKGDFTKFMGESHYSTKCKTNTDIYQFCGKKKLICISEFYENIIHHLPNIYVNGDNGRNKLGSDDVRMRNKLRTLLK